LPVYPGVDVLKIHTGLLIALILCGPCISVSAGSVDVGTAENNDTDSVWENSSFMSSQVATLAENVTAEPTATPAENVTAEPVTAFITTETAVLHPALWNVSTIPGTQNYTGLFDIPGIGNGDTIRIWGLAGHTYEGGITLSAQDVTVEKWTGSPIRPLITNTSVLPNSKTSAFTINANNITLNGLNISETYLSAGADGAGVNATGTEDTPLEKLTITDCIFTANSGNGNISSDYAFGGALYAMYVNDLRVTSTAFEKNNASGCGGAVFLYGGSSVFSENMLEGNTAKWVGGGVYFESLDSIYLTGTTFKSNTAGYYGGGAYFSNSEGIILTGTTFETNAAEWDGGGAYFYNSDGVILTHNTFESNTAGDYGGGAEIYSSENVSLANTVFTNNTAGWYGGGVEFWDSDNASLKNTILMKNTAAHSYDTELLYTADNSADNFALTDRTFERHTLGSHNCGTEPGHSEDATLTGTLTAYDTEEGWGGGMDVYSSDNTILTNLTIESNTAGESGGGVYVAYSEGVTQSRIILDSNTAGTSGGGVYYEISKKASLTEIVFVNNTANYYGGGAYFNDSEGVTQSRIILDSNTAGTSGGGVYYKISKNASLTDIVFVNNTANYYGGGAYFNDSDSATLFEIIFKRNSAGSTGGGGAYFDYSDDLRLSSTIFENNSAGHYGGGAFIENSEGVTLSDTTIEYNTAGYGGGVCAKNSALSVTNNFFRNEDNFYLYSDESVYPWNLVFNRTLNLTENIAGGPYLGGNVWTNPAGTGFSQTQSDADFDGICDNIYVINDSDSNSTVVGMDYLPLYYNISLGTVLAASNPQGADVLLDGLTYNHTTPSGYYLPPGNYSVVLTLPGYFESPVIPVSVTTGCEESMNYTFCIPTFRHTDTGPSPLNFVANATQPPSDVTSWTWQITNPDSSVTEKTGRNLSAVLRATGTYTIILNANWSIDKTARSESVNISVLEPVPNPKASEKTTARINGTTVEQAPNGTQTIHINESYAGNVTTTATTIQVEKTDGTTIHITTDGTTSAAGNVSGTVRSVTMTPPVLNATIGGSVGNASVGLSMTMDTYDPDATITTEIAAGCADDAKNAFSLAAPNLNQVAYTVYFTKSGFDNESAISGAVLDFSVNTTWVTSMGGSGMITIIRWKDDGNSTQITPTYLGISGGESLFQVTTDGFSVYGVASVSSSATTGTGVGGGSSASAAAASDLRTGVPATLSFDNQLFRAITLLPAENISDVLVTVESKSGPEKGMGTLENATVAGYVLTTLYHTEPTAFSSISYNARISMKWLTEEEIIPVVWYYNTTDSAWHQLEITNGTVGTEYIQFSVPAEMPGFGWFAIGGVPGAIAYKESYLVSGPEETSPGSPNGQESPIATAPAPTATKKATPVPGIVIAGGIGLAAALVLSRRKE